MDGFVLWTTVDDAPALDAVASTGRPAAIQGGPPAASIKLVAPDGREVARVIASLMLELATPPLLLSLPLDRDRWSGLTWGPNTNPAFPITRARLTGFREAVEGTERNWKDIPVAVVARHTLEDGRRAVERALDDVRPDAVIAMSDQLAAGALDVLGTSVTVSGWDDTELAASRKFTTIRQSLFDQGVTCARVAAGLAPTASTPDWVLVLHQED